MFCKKCGSSIPDDSVFCKVCGVRITGEGADNTEDSPPLQNSKEAFKKDPQESGDQDVDSEKELWKGTRSGKAYFLYYFIGILLTAAGCAGALFLDEEFLKKVPGIGRYLAQASGPVRLIPIIIPLVFLFIVWLKTLYFKYSLRYLLTEQRFFVIKGLISRQIDELELLRVNDVLMNQNVWDRLMGIGNVTILSNDESTPEVKMIGIPDPENAKEKIRNAAAKKRKSGLYVENI